MTGTLRIVVLALLIIALFATWAAADNDLKVARDVIGKQMTLIKAGDVAKLKAGFTPRLQDRITQENVKKAQKEIGQMTLDDLVASAAGSGNTIKIKMKNGRTLTTLVRGVKGSWLADTIWFK